MRSRPVTIGCAAGCDILVAGEGISRNHCVLQLVQGRFELVDANSTGLTYVQGRRIGKRELEDDDTIRLGPDVSLVFEDHR